MPEVHAFVSVKGDSLQQHRGKCICLRHHENYHMECITRHACIYTLLRDAAKKYFEHVADRACHCQTERMGTPSVHQQGCTEAVQTLSDTTPRLTYVGQLGSQPTQISSLNMPLVKPVHNAWHLCFGWYVTLLHGSRHLSNSLGTLSKGRTHIRTPQLTALLCCTDFTCNGMYLQPIMTNMLGP